MTLRVRERKHCLVCRVNVHNRRETGAAALLLPMRIDGDNVQTLSWAWTSVSVIQTDSLECQSFMSRSPRIPHSVSKDGSAARCLGRKRVVLNSMYGSAFWRQPTANSLHAFLVLLICFANCKLMLSVRYPHQLDMTYPPPPKGRAPCRNLKTTRTLTPRCGVWIRYVLLPISINPNSSG